MNINERINIDKQSSTWPSQICPIMIGWSGQWLKLLQWSQRYTNIWRLSSKMSLECFEMKSGLHLKWASMIELILTFKAHFDHHKYVQSWPDDQVSDSSHCNEANTVHMYERLSSKMSSSNKMLHVLDEVQGQIEVSINDRINIDK